MGGLAVAKKWSAEADEALKKAIAEGVSLQRLAIRFKIRKQGPKAKASWAENRAPPRLSQEKLGFKIRKR